jgi:hypothetical protein
MARGKQSRGLGDTIAKVTKATGLDKLVGDECGCEERRQRLNERYAYKLKVINCPDEQDVIWYNDFKVNRTLSPTQEQKEKVSELYGSIFDLPKYKITNDLKPYLRIVERLDNVFE